jgi:hypothetical protein
VISARFRRGVCRRKTRMLAVTRSATCCSSLAFFPQCRSLDANYRQRRPIVRRSVRPAAPLQPASCALSGSCPSIPLTPQRAVSASAVLASRWSITRLVQGILAWQPGWFTECAGALRSRASPSTRIPGHEHLASKISLAAIGWYRYHNDPTSPCGADPRCAFKHNLHSNGRLI